LQTAPFIKIPLEQSSSVGESTVGSEGAVLRHPRLASLATGEWPAWLWSADGSRILWTNAVGAAIFGAETAAACAKRRFYVSDLPAAQVIRLAATLPADGQDRLERLRGFGGNVGRPLTCACSRAATEDGTGAVLIAATEAAGPALSLTERVQRLFTESEEAIAVFLSDGRLLYANAVGQKRLGGASRLDILGFDGLAAEVRQRGAFTASARLNGSSCEVVAMHLGQDANSVLLVTMPRLGTPPAPNPATSPPVSERRPEAIVAQADPAAIAVATSPPQPRAAAVQADAMGERRHPLRFVWDMDADGRFTVTSDEFIELAGRQAALLGQPWGEIAAALKLDPDNKVTRAMATRETWSGITVSWPVGIDRNSERRLAVELSGLPIFDRDRNFCGYRGFGVCRDLAPINGLSRMDHGESPQNSASPAASTTPAADGAPDQTLAKAKLESAALEHPAAGLDPDLANVVPFRPAPLAEAKTASGLSPVERRAFHELAQELSSRLHGEAAPVVEASEQSVETREQEPGAQPGDMSRQQPEAGALAGEPIVRTRPTERPPSGNEDHPVGERKALRAAAAKAEFVAKISHEIRTPLTAITGFAEAIMAERFGPIGNERYREYIRDIHGAAAHLSGMLNDLLDLSRVETGRIDLTFANVNLNDLTQQCVGIMQPQANRARIIIRTALTTGLPPVVADERALRQIVLNLLSNSIRSTGPGGQIIVSTVLSDAREAILRVRDTGAGMSEKDVQAALEPFRDLATSASSGSGGSGFGLPLTKALAEANHAHFSIKSAPEAGTLIEIAFPPNRLVAA
jgi:signal transduction histidine kinase/PAS domain-containing protein